METTKTTETVPVDGNNGGEGAEVEMISIPKQDYDVLNQTLGSVKRELKDLKKAPKEEPKETHKNSSKEPEEFGLLQKTFLRAAGVATEDEMELARKIQKETGMDWDKVTESKYFKLELEELRTTKSNAIATSNIRGAQGKSDSKNNPEYWISKGTPPSATDVPDKKARAKIARAMMANTKTGKKFYND